MSVESEENNRRNGRNGKTLRTSAGSFELLTPRDRKGSFEPQIAKKRQTTELEAKVLSTYASGMGYRVHMLRKYMTTKYQQQRYLVLPINCYQ